MDIFEEFIAVRKLYNRNISVKSVLLMLSVLDITFDSHLEQYLKNSYLPTNNQGGTLKVTISGKKFDPGNRKHFKKQLSGK